MKRDALSKILDFIFNKNNTKYIVILFLIGIILRLIFSSMLGGSADEMVYGTHAKGIINSGLLQEMHEDPIWFYLTDLSYKIFGMTLISSRLLSIIFGALSTIALYLLTKEMFNKKIALIASFLLTFSAYHILMTLTEMDIAMTFFALLSSYFLIKYLKNSVIEYHVIGTILLGIGILVKNSGALFIPGYLIALIIYPKIKYKQKILSKKTIKSVIIFLILMLIMALPTLIFNYILYQEKGITDLQFSRFLSGDDKGIYQSIAHTIRPFSLETLLVNQGNGNPGILEGIRFYWSYSIFLVLGSIIGIIFGIKKYMKEIVYLLLLFIIPFLFMSGTSLLEKHFVFAVPIFCIFSSFGIVKISEISRKNSKKIIIILLIIFLIISTIKLYQHTKFEKNPIQKTIEYKNKNIDYNSLVIVDSRIFNGRIAFIFNDRVYLESIYFYELAQQLNQPTNKKIKTYIIECAIDDCGWGTISNQPELNQSTENIISEFKRISSLKETIKFRGDPYLNIYETDLPFIPGTIEAAQNTHNLFFYPVNYNPREAILLKYDATNPLHKFLDRIAHIILYIQLLIALLSIIGIILLLIKNQKDETIDNNAGV